MQTQAFSTSGIETSVVRVANDLTLADFEQLLQTNFVSGAYGYECYCAVTVHTEIHNSH